LSTAKSKVLMLPEPGTHTGGWGCWMGRGQRFTVGSWK
jgi:hypothetical protein